MERHSDVLLSSAMAGLYISGIVRLGDIIEIVLHCGVCCCVGYMTEVVRMSLATTPVMLHHRGE